MEYNTDFGNLKSVTSTNRKLIFDKTTKIKQKKIYMNGELLDYTLYMTILNYKKMIMKFSIIQGFLELTFYILVIIDVNSN